MFEENPSKKSIHISFLLEKLDYIDKKINDLIGVIRDE